MVTPPRSYQIDQLNRQVQIVGPDGKPTLEFLQQWNLLLRLVKQTQTLSAVSGVTAGVYGNALNIPQITVDELGRITDAEDIPISATPHHWELIEFHDFAATPQATLDVDVVGYTDLLVIFVGVTVAVSGTRMVLLSVDGGSTFYSTLGDYVSVLATGGITGANILQPAGTASALARSGNLYIYGINVPATVKTSSSIANPAQQFLASLDPVTDIRIGDSSGSNLTGGQVYVLAR